MVASFFCHFIRKFEAMLTMFHELAIAARETVARLAVNAQNFLWKATLVISRLNFNKQRISANLCLTCGCVGHLISFLVSLSLLISAASFDLMVWFLVILSCWWTSTQESQIRSQHSTQKLEAGLSSLAHLGSSSTEPDDDPLPLAPSSVCAWFSFSIRK